MYFEQNNWNCNFMRYKDEKIWITGLFNQYNLVSPPEVNSYSYMSFPEHNKTLKVKHVQKKMQVISLALISVVFLLMEK